MYPPHAPPQVAAGLWLISVVARSISGLSLVNGLWLACFLLTPIYSRMHTRINSAAKSVVDKVQVSLF